LHDATRLVILARDTVLEYLGEVTVPPVTSIIRDIPSEVLLSRLDGMPRDCAINLDYIQTVSKGKIGALITTLSAEKMAQLRQALLSALGFGM
jgi:mRNA interferase MazF